MTKDKILKSILALMLLPAGQRLVAHFVGVTGEMTIGKQLLLDILSITAGILMTAIYLAFSYWHKDRPRQRVETAIKQGRQICHCTEIGVIMLQAKEKDQGIQDYYCPRCRRRTVKVID